MSKEFNRARNPTASREEEADQDLRHTQISPRIALVISIAFISLLFAIISTQIIVELNRPVADKTHRVPAIADIVDILPSREAFGRLRYIRGPRSVVKYGLGVFPESEKIKAFEKRLEEESVLSEVVLSPSQYFLTRFLKTGNHDAYVGQGGWLFYNNDVAQAILPWSLDTTVTTISDVVRQFREQGIEVIVMPMVSKASLYPDKLAFCSGIQYPLSNPQYDTFLSELRGQNILAFDTTAAAAKIRREQPDSPWFLETDTHWRPELAAKVAEELAFFIKKNIVLPPANPLYHVRPVQGKWPQGDLVRMLNLMGTPLYPEESVVYHQVIDSQGQPWKSDTNADVLVFGDSFTEVFEKYQAGLAENLSVALGRPVDRFGKPGPGMTRFKEKVSQELCQQPQRLRAKRLIIWEFTIRDILSDDWGEKDLSLPKNPNPQASISYLSLRKPVAQ
jgi:hypothetical protein